MSDPKRVGDVATERERFDGSSVKVRALEGREFAITRIVPMSSSDGPYLGVQIEAEGKPFFFFSSHVVIMRKLKECIGSEPLLATITKVETDDEGGFYFDIA